MKKSASVSRRQWFERMALPAAAATAAGMIGLPAAAAPVGSSVAALSPGAAVTAVFNVRDFGARGDGQALDTAAIQSAIDACHAARGGTVLIPAGEFICGTIELRSGVTLHVAAQGKLLGSKNREDYTAGKGVPPGNGNIVFIYAANAGDIAIEGYGTIDGNGLAFYNGKGDNTGPGQRGVGGNFDRPHLIVFYQCSRFYVKDIFLTNSAYHCFRILKCRHVQLHNIRIHNRVNKNNDGFHFNDTQYVHITGCDVQCQDDACALFGSNQFVTVSDCSFSTRWSVFRFGGGEAQNITVTNCLIYETYGCPIKISSGNARIENLRFSHITMRNVTGPIGIGFTGVPANAGNQAASDTPPPFVRNISFSNIYATVVAKPVNHPDIHFGVNVFDGELNSCITLNGVGKAYLENISFSDVHVVYAGGGTAEQAAKRKVPELSAEYFGVWATKPAGPPAYGLYARNVKGLTLHNVRFSYEKTDARPAVILDNVADVTVIGLSAQGNNDGELLRLVNAKDVFFSALRLLGTAAVLLRAEGPGTARVKIEGGVLGGAARLLVVDDGASKREVVIRS